MGTRADFYVGRGANAEWIGSIGWDGYPDGNPEVVLDAKDEGEFRAKVAELLEKEDGTTPAMGWPWPWDNSNTTDYSYAFDGGEVWITCYGHGWNTVPDWRKAAADEEGDGDMKADKIPDSEWPDMKKIKNVTLDPARSGVMVFGGAPKP